MCDGAASIPYGCDDVAGFVEEDEGVVVAVVVLVAVAVEVVVAGAAAGGVEAGAGVVVVVLVDVEWDIACPPIIFSSWWQPPSVSIKTAAKMIAEVRMINSP